MLAENGISSTNIQNCFEKEQIRQLYVDTKILLNIRQTPHHDTLEELRILPALLNGVIILSEDAPLRNAVPYSEFIIFVSPEAMAGKIRYVLENYEHVWNGIFRSQRFAAIMAQLKEKNEERITGFLTKLIRE
jgi:hypothetical protein